MAGKHYAKVEDIQALAMATLCHRLQLDAKAKYGGAMTQDIVEEALAAVPVPR